MPNEKTPSLFENTPDDPKVRKPEREFVERFDKERHLKPVEYEWVKPSLGNFG